jgi:hypothetical protein
MVIFIELSIKPIHMQFRAKILLLGFVTVAAIIVTSLMKPLPQDPAYHAFADRHTIAGVPNFMNVLTNFPFIVVGIIGLSLLNSSKVKRAMIVIYALLFAGIILIGLGSSYYHYAPDSNRLVFDRIPMTIVFMAFLSAVIAECINAKVGFYLLFPLVAIGIASVLAWHFSELNGHSDLRFYGFVQFYPVLIIPLILILFPSPVNAKAWLSLMWVVIWYVIAKVLEQFDTAIFSATGFISGHSLKHLAATVATWYMVRMFVKKYIIRPL